MIHIATELKTSITYTGTGSQKLFDIPFDYLRTSFVKTNVDDIVLTYGEDYVIINRQIEFTVAPISGSHVVIYRETATDRLVSWADASVLKASDMTINQVQQLHILEEQQDWTKTNSIVMEGTIGWNARFHRIINVGDPVEPQDAVTKQYVEDVKTGFISEMIKVKNSAITEITDIKNKAIEAINNLKASTETYLTQLKDTFKSFVTEKTEEVNSLKESAVNETTNIKNTAIEELTAIKDAAVNETTEIKDEAVAAKNTAVEAAATAAEDAVNNVQTLLDEKVAAAENAKSAAVSSAESAASSATTATEQADRAQDIADNLEGLAGITGRATTEEAIAGVVDTKAMTPLKTKEAIEQGTNVFTALNTFRANIRVSNGSAAGSSGSISFGISPANETVQARIGTDLYGGLFYQASTNQPHVFRNGSNLNALVIRANDTNMNLSSGGVMFATVNYAGGARWLGNANTASKLETARTINGVAFDGTKDITIYNTEGHLVFPNGAEFWIG